MSERIPIVCSLTPEALAARRESLLRDLVLRADACEDRPAGRRLRFRPEADTLAMIARTVDAERHCCRFLRFDIIVEPDGGPIWLELSDPAGTRAFLAALFEA